MAIVPTISKTAIQTPTPIAPTIQSFIANTGNPGTATKNSNLAQGDVGGLITKFNANALRADLTSTYGGGGYGVLWGLTLAENASLNILVNAGQANIISLTELATGTVLNVPASSSGCYIWLKDNGTLTYQNGSLTPPDTASLYLGCITTSASGVTGIDMSGVPYIKGNTIWRQTADLQAPTDTPPATMTLTTQGSGWVYDWDGTQHKQRVPPEQMIFKTNGPSMVGGHLTYNYLVTSGSGAITLTSASANIQRVLPTATLNVTLPSSGTLNPGQWFDIYNDAASGSGFNVVVKNGGTTVSTVTPKMYSKFRAVVSGTSTFNWPASVAPVDPTL